MKGIHIYYNQSFRLLSIYLFIFILNNKRMKPVVIRMGYSNFQYKIKEKSYIFSIIAYTTVCYELNYAFK